MKCHSGKWHVALATALVCAHVAHAGPNFHVKITSAEVSNAVRIDGIKLGTNFIGMDTFQLSVTALEQCSGIILEGSYISSDGVVTDSFYAAFSNTAINRKYRQDFIIPNDAVFLSLEKASCLPSSLLP